MTSYAVEAIDPHLRLHSVTGGVYRVHGEGFSLVIKVVRNGNDADPDGLWVSGALPSHRNYWKREWLAYSSGMLDTLPGELRAPRTLLATEPAEDECWIWMEDVEGRPGAEWELDDYDSVGVRPRDHPGGVRERAQRARRPTLGCPTSGCAAGSRPSGSTSTPSTTTRCGPRSGRRRWRRCARGSASCGTPASSC